MGKNGKKEIELAFGQRAEEYDKNPREIEPAFSDIETASRIREIMTIPAVDDMPSVMARAVFKNDRQRLAVVKLHKRHIKFHDFDNEAALRAWCASTIALNGLGRFEQTQVGIGVWADNSYRVARGFSQNKDESKIYKSSDFKSEDKEKEAK